ncbi:MAG: translocation/assembly module TamB domain-containing protein, partial [Myxococcota bacterium]
MARDASVDKAIAPLDLDLKLQQTSTNTTILTNIAVGRAPLLEARISSPTTIAKILQPDYDWSAAPIEGKVTNLGFPLPRVLANKSQQADIGGQLSLRANVEGTASAPKIDAFAKVDGMRIGRKSFDRFEAYHTQNADFRRTRLDLRQNTGGILKARFESKEVKPVDIAIDAKRFDIGFLATVSEMLQAGAAVEGILDGQVAMQEQTDGRLTASNLRIAISDAPPIEQGTLNITLANQRSEIDLQARSGPGRMRAKLTAILDAAPSVKGQFVLDDVQIVGGGQVASVDLNGRITGQSRNDRFDTEVILTDGLIRLPDRSSRDLHPITNRSDIVYQRSRWRGVRPTKSRSSEPSALSFRVRTAKPIGVRGEPLDVVVNTDVVARPQRRGVSIKGDARVEQGTVTLFGRRYTVERTQVTLGGQVPPEPRVDILLSYEFNACTFFISFGGPLANPKLQLSAEPGIYDDKQLLGFLFGASPDEDNPDKTPQQQGVDAAAGLLL